MERVWIMEASMAKVVTMTPLAIQGNLLDALHNSGKCSLPKDPFPRICASW